ncbi:hypothetical protein TKK_0019637 [Trichogramma kaykai]|uniref:TsaA-like domain-containing protein n=1 Tax=Trichogramma kaykai TaxID=54128 RepID=A0ABD2VS98_9HYME
MEENYQNLESNPKYLMQQLLIARTEINNLRQQIKGLRYSHEKEVVKIKQLLGNIPVTDSCNSTEPASNNLSLDKETLQCQAIGTISTWFPSKRGTPRQPVICSKAPGKIVLNKNVFTNPEHALQGLEQFSHIWILFHFHRNESNHVRAKIAPPRLNGVKTGVFSTRSPHRPCPIGLSLVKIIKIQDCTIYFEGVDMVDQTPVLDIKPYIPQYDNPLNVERVLQAVQLKEDIDMDVKNIRSLSNDDPNENVDTSLYDFQLRKEQNFPPCTASSSRVFASNFTGEMTNLESTETNHVENLSSNFSDNAEGANSLEDRELEAIMNNSDNSNSISYNISSSELNSQSEFNIRNSRLMDGADGPHSGCSADINLISRHVSNLGLNNLSSSSPIRMDMREAPDGEEGLDLQQNAQTLSTNRTTINQIFHGNSRAANSNIEDEAIRVPDWISQDHSAALNVNFNERSLMQLREIAKDKCVEKKQAVENVLKEDPRSVYLRQRYGNQFYTFLIHDLHITCKFDDDSRIVTVFQIRHATRTCDCGEPEWQCPGHSPTKNSSAHQKQ